jgi:hypothetical protein
MKTFKDLEFKPHTIMMGGVKARIMFENGYGASVVQTSYSLGGKNNLYELAVLYNNAITDKTPIANDVLGYLSEDDVTFYLNQIENL